MPILPHVALKKPTVHVSAVTKHSDLLEERRAPGKRIYLWAGTVKTDDGDRLALMVGRGHERDIYYTIEPGASEYVRRLLPQTIHMDGVRNEATISIPIQDQQSLDLRDFKPPRRRRI